MIRQSRRWWAMSATGVIFLTLVSVVAGCSKSVSAQPTSTTSATSVRVQEAPAQQGPAQLTIDGQLMNVAGAVVCSTTDGKFSIAVGELGTGYIVGLEPDGSVVHNVGLPIQDNGLVLAYTEGVPGDEATATKDGNTYTVTGT